MSSAVYPPEGPQEPAREGAQDAHPPPRPAGRPKSAPSTVLNLRLPLDLVHQLDRYLDHLEVHTGLKANRGMIARRALTLFLETHAPHGRGAPKPDEPHASNSAAPPEASR
jgi:hypothetical protein